MPSPLAFGAGSLIRGPVSSTAPSYGGTVLATLGACLLRPRRIVREIRGEEFAGAVVDWRHARWEITLEATDLSWDQDALLAYLPDVSTTQGDGVTTIDFGGGNGYSKSVEGVQLLYVPDRVLTEPAFLIEEALGVPADAMLAWDDYAPRRHRMTFETRKADTGNAHVTVGLLSRIWTP